MITLVHMRRIVTSRMCERERERNMRGENLAIINGNFMLHSLLYDVWKMKYFHCLSVSSAIKKTTRSMIACIKSILKRGYNHHNSTIATISI